jgi:periplasmic protein TonB
MRIFLVCLVLFVTAAVSAKAPQYDKAPVFPGGNNALIKYLTDKLVYPEEARKKGIEGKVMVGFMIDTKGRVTNVNVLKHIHPLLDSEAVRVIRAMPKWQPAKKGKENVLAPVALPITFTLKKPGKK